MEAWMNMQYSLFIHFILIPLEYNIPRELQYPFYNPCRTRRKKERKGNRRKRERKENKRKRERKSNRKNRRRTQKIDH
jgi:hypothetical protein